MWFPEQPFDVSGLEGQWFEIAKAGAWFEGLARNVTAEYTLLEPGVVGVANRATVSGAPWEVTGLATVTPDPLEFDLFMNGRPPRTLRVLWWDDDYQTLLLGGGEREMVWVMARSPGQLSREDTLDLVAYAGSLGYPRNGWRWTEHDEF